ncbi:MAG: sigma-54 dependent transcriptional regulator [Myxococcales bacterium]|nr:sigma-54 dependent transcriptional regulator [Myxococcales bacterium]
MMAAILAVEDDALYGEALIALLEGEGHCAERVGTLEAARRRLIDGVFDLVLLDTSLPDGRGTELLPELRQRGGPRVMCLTAHADVPAVVEAMRAGAYDYVTKSAGPVEVLERIDHALPVAAPALDNDPLARELLGESEAMQTVRRLTRLASQTTTTVLLQGDTGTGKSHIARLIHQGSERSEQPLVTVDCAALSENLAESELFGHERGSFTGAVNRHIGAIESAAAGTLFFDEITDLPAGAQGKLLRVLEERVLRRVGGNREFPVHARIVAATRHDLRERVDRGQFREDLYFRLSVLELKLPALRERLQDVPALLSHFLQREGQSLTLEDLPETLRERLRSYPFPGNVRELRNLVERLLLMRTVHGRAPTAAELGLGTPANAVATALQSPQSPMGPIQSVGERFAMASRRGQSGTRPRAEGFEDLAEGVSGFASTPDAVLGPAPAEGSDAIGRALVASGGRIGEAARSLGISRHALRRRLKKIQEETGQDLARASGE